ncbi:MAG: hypothetical protein HDS65_04310 [Bacteroidales bacterium]|nr:hypothetical protein [Bacteroidales bacterium]
MAPSTRKSSGLWAWIVIAIIVAAIAVGTLYYIGWFDAKSHVDTPAGDNVTEQYDITVAGADKPGEADWQNAGGQSLREVITEPASETQTPPSAE